MARKKKTLRQEIENGLKQLAFGDVQDCIYLLFSTEDDILKNLSGLNLMNLSEIKRPRGGGTEVKFFDRIKAFEALSKLSNGTEKEPLNFYAALQQGAENIESVFKEQENE